MLMATNLQLYSLIYCTVNSALLVEHISVDVRRLTDAQVIKTVAKGWAGLSPGANWCSIDIVNALPSAGFELDPTPFMQALQSVEIGLELAGKQARSKGFIIEDNWRQAVDTPAQISFKFLGTFPTPQ